MDRLGHRLEALEERIGNSQSLTPPALETVSKQASPRSEPPPAVSSEPENATSSANVRFFFLSVQLH
jgi:hypothetical protein